MKILIMGLPGSGKTTLATHLVTQLTSVEWINADIVRSQFNDWDFSINGRYRQCNRLKFLAESSTAEYVICDFVAPTEDIRKLFNADFTIFVDTCSTCKYVNTNQIFKPPLNYHIKVTTQNAEYWASVIKTLIDNH